MTTDWYVKGSSGTVRKPSVGGGWRGLGFRLLAATVDSDTFVIPWDSIIADSDGIASASDHTFGAFTALAGQHGVVPVGMAGLWTPAINLTIRGPSSATGQLEVLTIKNNFEDFFDFIFEDLSGGLPADGLTISGASWPWVLAEGDVIWNLLSGPVTGSGINLDSTLLLEYTGFVP